MRIRNRMRQAGAILTAVATVALAACSPADDTPTQPSLTVGLGYIGTVENYGPYYALHEGLYRDAGLAVDVQPGGNTPPSTLLVAGQIDIGVMDAPDMLHAVEQGADLVAIATQFQTAPTAMTCRRASNISTVADLKGHVLGLKGQEQSYLNMIMQTGGLQPSDFTVVPVGNSDISPIVAGQVDCLFATYAINDGRAIEAAGVPVTNISLAELGLPAQGDVYVTTADTFNNRRDDLTRWVKATGLAWEKFLADPTAAAHYMVDNAFAPGLDLDQQIYQANKQVPFLSTEWTRTRGLLALDPGVWASTSDQMARFGMTGSVVDVHPLLHDLAGEAGTARI
ncbi:MAG: ABC transporter substrate-binding protein [Actinobacteria bacterium]|nr:ABC transporter substrate-binding protein [Actinomycetota bacterium]